MEYNNTAAPSKTIYYQYAGDTDQGRVRANNEDHVGLFPQQGLFFVADGMGGMPAGEIASMLILEVLPTLLAQRIADPEILSQDEIIAKLKQALIDLSNRILKESREHPEYAGMGSTLVLLYRTKKNTYIANLGDSRAYVLKGEVLRQVTHDHTTAQYLFRCHEITQEEALYHPGKNQLLQYIGMKSLPNPDVICLPDADVERVLLCSDGLTNMLSEQEITQFLLQNSPPDKMCKALITAANLAGGKDNISVVLVA